MNGGLIYWWTQNLNLCLVGVLLHIRCAHYQTTFFTYDSLFPFSLYSCSQVHQSYFLTDHLYLYAVSGGIRQLPRCNGSMTNPAHHCTHLCFFIPIMSSNNLVKLLVVICFFPPSPSFWAAVNLLLRQTWQILFLLYHESVPVANHCKAFIVKLHQLLATLVTVVNDSPSRQRVEIGLHKCMDIFSGSSSEDQWSVSTACTNVKTSNTTVAGFVYLLEKCAFIKYSIMLKSHSNYFTARGNSLFLPVCVTQHFTDVLADNLHTSAHLGLW